MTDYLEGARLRVAYDVTVIGGGGWQTDHGHYIGGLMQRDAVSVERLPDPEPDWQPGDVVRAANGKTYAREVGATEWRLLAHDPATFGGPWKYDGDVPRPLTPLVRGGKPWGET